MKTSKIISSVFAMLLTVSVAFPQGTETRTPGSFTKIESHGSWDVEITKGSKDEIRLESSSFDLSKVITAIEKGKLEIKLEKGNYRNVDLKVFITVRELESVGNGGSGDMVIKSDFGADSFGIGLSGSGSISAKKYQCPKTKRGHERFG